MEIKTYNKAELEAFINNPVFKRLDAIPISRHRAESYIQNPRCEDDDILLVAAFEGNQLLGYQSVLPDYLFYKGQKKKVGWLSGLWVAPESRGKGVGRKVMETVLETWDHQVLVTEFTAEARQLFDRLGVFVPLKTLQSLRIYQRFNLHELLPPKSPVFQKSRFLLKGLDQLANAIFDFRFPFFRPDVQDLHYEYPEGIDQESGDFIEHFAQQNGELTQRGSKELKWIIQYPWIRSSSKPDPDADRYFFSSIEPFFAFVSLKIRNSAGELIAFLLMARRNDHLKLPYCYVKQGWQAQVADGIVDHMARWRITMLTVFHEDLVAVLQKKQTLALYRKPFYRYYLTTQRLAQHLPPGGEIRFQDGDGDCVFT